MKISVSFLKSKYDLETTIKKINETNADFLHVDVMDGKFVPNISCVYEEVSDTLKMSNNPKFNKIITKSASYWTNEEFNNLSGLLHFEFGLCKGVNDNFKNWLKCTKVSGIEFLKIYKNIIIENKKKFNIDEANKRLNELRSDNTTS